MQQKLNELLYWLVCLNIAQLSMTQKKIVISKYPSDSPFKIDAPRLSKSI